MRRHDREQRILQLLAEAGQMSVSDFVDALSVSPATVRRELQEMEERGQLRRIHGGATLDGVACIEPLFEDKEGRQTTAKSAIAERALSLIENGATIYLDGGSTVLMLARLLNRRRHLTIVTNSLMAMSHLLDTEHRLILVGGEFRSLSRTVVGPLTAATLKSLHVDIAFMGTIGFTLEHGMMTTEPAEAFTKELIMQRAQRVALLADGSKLGVASLACSGRVQDIDNLITDQCTAAMRKGLTDAGVEVLLAGEG